MQMHALTLRHQKCDEHIQLGLGGRAFGPDVSPDALFEPDEFFIIGCTVCSQLLLESPGHVFQRINALSMSRSHDLSSHLVFLWTTKFSMLHSKRCNRCYKNTCIRCWWIDKLSCCSPL